MPTAEPTPELDPRFSEPGAQPTPWAQVRDLLEAAELFWISTVRGDGRPHVVPLPAVWRDDALFFCTGPDEQKAVNLGDNDACALTTGTNRWKEGLDVVVEGRARRVTDEASLRELAAMWDTKYRGDWQFEVRDGAFHHGPGAAHVFEVRPAKVLAFAKGDFAQTRYRFGRP
jgi:nitroimidazol reductase NimA-like FMN-containing flavoprotein (pyridoxamine 5'-phosphate oxidase superfamily)